MSLTEHLQTIGENTDMRRLTAKIIDNGPLTPKEAEVLKYLCEGYFRPEIALKLHRTLSTVSKHIEHIAEKFEAHGSTEIVLIAQQLGLVEISLTEKNHINKALLVLLMITQLFSPVQGRRPPQSPRPAVRLIKRACSG